MYLANIARDPDARGRASQFAGVAARHWARHEKARLAGALWASNLTVFLSATYESYITNARKARRDAATHLAHHRSRKSRLPFPQRRVGGIVNSHAEIAALYMKEARYWHDNAQRLLKTIRSQTNGFSFVGTPLAHGAVVNF